MAEAVRFELTNGCPLPVFKTGAIDHSATPPVCRRQGAGCIAARMISRYILLLPSLQLMGGFCSLTSALVFN